VRLHAESRGTGVDLVMLHGWGMHSAMWGELADGLAGFCRVTTVDLPGHGLSPALEPEHAASLSGWAAAVAEVAPARAVWLGWSLGGLVAMRAALDFPQRVSRLILVAANASFVQRPDWPRAQPSATLDGFAAGLRQDYRTVLQRFLALQAWGSEDARRQVRMLRESLFVHGEPHPAALAAGLRMLKQADLRRELPGLTQPALLIAGQRDTLVPPAALKSMVQLMPDARMETVPGAGHAPFLFHSGRFRQLVGEFLSSARSTHPNQRNNHLAPRKGMKGNRF